jgi:predicted ATPase
MGDTTRPHYNYKLSRSDAEDLVQAIGEAGLTAPDRLQRTRNFRRNYRWIPEAERYLDQQVTKLAALVEGRAGQGAISIRRLN